MAFLALSLTALDESQIRSQENWLFFKRWLKKPAQLGTLAPISYKLAKTAAMAIGNPNQKIVEIGAGSGRLTRALLAHGVKPENLALVELDSDLCDFLKTSLKPLSPIVIEGDAAKLKSILPKEFIGQTTTVVSAIPFMYIGENLRQKIIDACFEVMPNNGKVIHVTYNPKSPLAFMDTLQQKRVGSLWFNIPPGFVWHFERSKK